MPYIWETEAEEENTPATYKRVLLSLSRDEVLFLTIYFLVLLLSTWLNLVPLNLSSAIKQSPNVKCLINTSCHQEKLCFSDVLNFPISNTDFLSHFLGEIVWKIHLSCFWNFFFPLLSSGKYVYVWVIYVSKLSWGQLSSVQNVTKCVTKQMSPLRLKNGITYTLPLQMEVPV